SGNSDALPTLPKLRRELLPRTNGIGEPEELVKPLIQGVYGLLAAVPRAALMPLAEDRRGITRRLQRLGDCPFAGGQVLVVAGHARMNRVLSGQERCPAGCAYGGGRIAAREDSALLRQVVEVGRLPLRTPVEPDIAPAQVVGHDE